MIKRFNRYELKYIIDARRYRALVEDLKYFMIPDEYGDVDGFYRVISLYYDSPTLSGYWAKLDGLKFRRKLRIRIYPGTDIRNVKKAFVEIKQRTNRTVQKKRLVLPIDLAERLCSEAEIPDGLDEDDFVAASEIAYMVRSLQLRPKAIVSYRRRAYMGGRYERGMRLTFDMQLQGRTHALKVNEIANNQYFMPPDWLVMEVKCNERVPAWVGSLLAKHDCQLQRISKYCAALANGVRLLHNASDHKENLYYG
jgi:hypothetical protein